MPRNTRKNKLKSYEAFAIAEKKANQMKNSPSSNPGGKGTFTPAVDLNIVKRPKFVAAVDIAADPRHLSRVRLARQNKARAMPSSATRILVKNLK
jgi:hypothetical protein